MSTKGHPLTRLCWALLVWIIDSPLMRAWMGSPSYFATLERRQSLWEYEQADIQSWDTESDQEGLIEAFALRHDDPERAVSLLFALAQEDSPIAINDIGEGYYWGKSLPCDEAEGEKWFERAFELGSRRGLLNYGKVLFYRKDLVAAEAVFRRGADGGWGPAFYWLARTEAHRDRSLKAVLRVRPYLERAAEMGSPMASEILGGMMSAGFFGVRHMPRGMRLMSEWAPKMEDLPPRKNVAGDTVH